MVILSRTISSGGPQGVVVMDFGPNLLFFGILLGIAAISKALGNGWGVSILIAFAVAIIFALVWNWWVGRPAVGGWFNRLINKLARTNKIEKNQENWDAWYCREHDLPYERTSPDAHH